MHRFDAELAVVRAGEVAADLAADGISDLRNSIATLSAVDSPDPVFAGLRGTGETQAEGYIVSGMAEENLSILPGFREMAERRRELVAELVARRHAAGLSQGEVAERMGTSQPAVARLEAGQLDARMSTMQRYAAAVGVRLHLGLAPSPSTREDK